MIPVRLQLKNFLSYGDSTPELDFEQFHVACLSGKNGQGKSALLDAITWALWGEARKSGGSIKPDDDLLRIGTREMQVDLVFDLEGERYRVTRSYYRSATGKTSKTQLELQLFDPTTATFKPITKGHLRETQREITEIIGLDYDTFINSAFLMQGRSDEFTRRGPTERKRILARILNLKKYNRLEELARERERNIDQEVERAEHDIERLEEALAQEPPLREAYDRAKMNIRANEDQLEVLIKSEEKQQLQLTDLRLEAEKARSVEQQKKAHEKQLVELEVESTRLEAQKQATRELLDNADRIRSDYERREALQKERDDWDSKQDVHRGLEQQIERIQRELNNWKNEVQIKLQTSNAQLRSDQEKVESYLDQLAKRESIESRLASSVAAQKQVRDLELIHQKREQLKQQITETETNIAKTRAGLEAQIKHLRESLKKEKADAEQLEKLRQEESRIRESANRYEAEKEKHDRITTEGIQQKAELDNRMQKLGTSEDELAGIRENIEKVQKAEWKSCPTCGTDLSPEHRKQVVRKYRAEIKELEKTIRNEKKGIQDLKSVLDTLREQVRSSRQVMEQLGTVAEELVRIREQIQQAERSKSAFEERQKTLKELESTLRNNDFAPEAGKALREYKDQLYALKFNEDAYRKIQVEAAQFERWKEALNQLEVVRQQLEGLKPLIKQREQDVQALRETLDHGHPTLQQQAASLRTKIEELGYDGQKHLNIKQELLKLAKAGEQFANLMNARQRAQELEEALRSNQDKQIQTRKEVAALTDTWDQIQEVLTSWQSEEKVLRELVQSRQGIENELKESRVELGHLSARLDRCEEDRKALKEQRKRIKQARKDRALYKHLRIAFGKHGIPSLIIEQTLPEIEQRANDLLHRLSEGYAYIKLESLKEKKTGGTKETLELRITDDQGVSRPYETFSGGEAFRVNFALRVALSQLLAERSGVRIRTLVIDEGFGTQDDQGVQNMVEAIQSVQRDFDKILVITHLRELKEAFPVRIEVQKHPVEGSSFEIIGV